MATDKRNNDAPGERKPPNPAHTEIQVENVGEHLRAWDGYFVSAHGVKYSYTGDPQAFLASAFDNGALPIRGGWGYSKEDAVIIDTAHPVADRSRPFNGTGVEYGFARLRMFLELVILRPGDKRYSGCQMELIRQELHNGDNGKKYDQLLFDITALPSKTWDALKAEWEGPHGIASPGFDKQDHIRRRDAATVHYMGEYWFEISSFFGMDEMAYPLWSALMSG